MAAIVELVIGTCLLVLVVTVTVVVTVALWRPLLRGQGGDGWP